jgi:predicted nucleic acid-binding protein
VTLGRVAKSSVPATSPIIILDAGPLVALADAPDPHHEWAATFIAATSRPFIVTSAAVAEATHILKNGPRALAFLEKLVTHMNVEDPAPVMVIAEMRRWDQRMDYADACAVLLARRHKGAVVLTTDHRDFSVYRVPFVSPLGEFHG